MTQPVFARALTIRQPWAGLVAAGVKDVENRTWATGYRGPLWIHAGARPEAGADTDPRVVAAAPTCPVWLLAARSRVLALAALVDVHPARPGCCSSVWANAGPGAWHWVLADPRVLPPELAPSCRGRLGLWRPPTGLQAPTGSRRAAGLTRRGADR